MCNPIQTYTVVKAPGTVKGRSSGDADVRLF